MRILELSLRNYRVFDQVDLELPARVIGIFGPNGSGKTSLVESVQFALYGRARTDKRHIRTHGILTDCAVRVVFEHGGQQYEVRRTIRGKAHQTDAELLVGDLVLASGVREVDAEIRGLLRMDQQVFRASVFAEQKQLDAFSEVTPGKRKDMVMRLLGIKPVEQALARARRQAKDTRGDAERLAGSLPDTAEQERALEEATEAATAAAERADRAREVLDAAAERAEAAGLAHEEADRLRQTVEKLEVERRGAAEQVESLEARSEDLEARIAALRRDLEALPTLQAELRRLEGSATALEAARRLVEAAGEMADVEVELGRLPEADVDAALAGLAEAEAARDAATAELSRAEAGLEGARREVSAAEEAVGRAAEADPSQPCPTCGRPLGQDFTEYLAHCRDRLSEAREGEATAVRTERDARKAWKAAQAGHRKAVELGERARLEQARRSGLGDRVERLRERVAALAEPFEGRTPDVGALEADARRATEVERLLAGLEADRKHLTQAERDLSRAGDGLSAARARLQDLERRAAALAFDPEEHARLRKERDEAHRLLEEARGEERAAGDAHQAALALVRELRAGIQKVQEVAAKVVGLREEARILGRVALLLDGFRDHLVARIGPELSREAQALFRELTNAEYDDLRIDEQSLAIEIADGTEYFSIERFSGSETDLANLALRVAISLHLSRMSGADVGMMVLDEVLGALDAERKDLFVQAMGQLASHFHQLFVITHAEQVKDRFPTSIEVRKVGRRRSSALLS